MSKTKISYLVSHTTLQNQIENSQQYQTMLQIIRLSVYNH